MNECLGANTDTSFFGWHGPAGVPVAHRAHLPFHTVRHHGQLQPSPLYAEHLLWVKARGHRLSCIPLTLSTWGGCLDQGAGSKGIALLSFFAPDVRSNSEHIGSERSSASFVRTGRPPLIPSNQDRGDERRGAHRQLRGISLRGPATGSAASACTHIHHDTALLGSYAVGHAGCTMPKGTDLCSISRCSRSAASATRKHMVCDLLWYCPVRSFSLRRFKGSSCMTSNSSWLSRRTYCQSGALNSTRKLSSHRRPG